MAARMRLPAPSHAWAPCRRRPQVSLRSARFIRDAAAYLQNSPAPARDMFSPATHAAVTSVVVVPLVVSGEALGAVYFAHGQACEWANLQDALLVGLTPRCWPSSSYDTLLLSDSSVARAVPRFVATATAPLPAAPAAAAAAAARATTTPPRAHRPHFRASCTALASCSRPTLACARPRCRVLFRCVRPAHAGTRVGTRSAV